MRLVQRSLKVSHRFEPGYFDPGTRIFIDLTNIFMNAEVAFAMRHPRFILHFYRVFYSTLYFGNIVSSLH